MHSSSPTLSGSASPLTVADATCRFFCMTTKTAGRDRNTLAMHINRADCRPPVSAIFPPSPPSEVVRIDEAATAIANTMPAPTCSVVLKRPDASPCSSSPTPLIIDVEERLDQRDSDALNLDRLTMSVHRGCGPYADASLGQRRRWQFEDDTRHVASLEKVEAVLQHVRQICLLGECCLQEYLCRNAISVKCIGP